MFQEVSEDFLLRDFGSSVTAGAVVGLGIMDRNSELLIGDQVVSVEYALTVRTDQFGELGYGDEVIHDGSVYRLQHEPLKLADDRYSVMVLELVTAGADAPTPSKVGEIDDDLMLRDFGSTVKIGNVTGLGIMDRKSDIIMGDKVISVEYALTVRTDEFGGFGYGNRVRFEGDFYELRHEPMRIADGRFSVMLLTKLEVSSAVFEVGVFVPGVFV